MHIKCKFRKNAKNILYIQYLLNSRHKRTKEELDKARIPHGHSAKGLTYRQAEAPDDLPKMDLRYGGETDDSEFGGSTTIQVHITKTLQNGWLAHSWLQ